MRKFTVLVICSLFTISLLAQREPVTVSYEQTSQGDFSFYADNRTGQNQTVAVYFKTLDGLAASVSLPSVKSIAEGRTRLFKLTRSGIGSPTIDFSFVYQAGTIEPESSSFIYSMPVQVGQESLVRELTNVNAKKGKAPANYYALSFEMEEGAMIHAARGGKVVRVEQSKEATGDQMTFSDVRNEIEIEHNDGTIGVYSVFKKGTAKVEVGDEILQGQALAISEGKGYVNGHHVRFMVQYLKINEELNPWDQGYFEWDYQKIKFLTEDGEVEELLDDLKYACYLDEEMIMQEMSKRQKKKYLKSKKSK